MDLQISSKNVELSEEMRRYIERKLSKLNRYLPNIVESRVEIIKEKTKSPEQHFVVHLAVNSNGTLILSEERGADLPTAIDKVAAVMNRRIEHYKGKLYDKRKGKKGNSSLRTAAEAAPETAHTPGKIVKVKRFTVKPMEVDEATSQMEILGHDFFLFFNAEDEKLNLVYRRKDSDYGLIQPELG